MKKMLTFEKKEILIWTQVWIMFIPVLPFCDAPLSNFKTSEDRAGPSWRRQELIIINQDSSVTPKLRDRLITLTNKKRKKKDKKDVISMGRLISSTNYFSSHDIIFPSTPTLYTVHKQKLLMLLFSLC